MLFLKGFLFGMKMHRLFIIVFGEKSTSEYFDSKIWNIELILCYWNKFKVKKSGFVSTQIKNSFIASKVKICTNRTHYWQNVKFVCTIIFRIKLNLNMVVFIRHEL